MGDTRAWIGDVERRVPGGLGSPMNRLLQKAACPAPIATALPFLQEPILMGDARALIRATLNVGPRPPSRRR